MVEKILEFRGIPLHHLTEYFRELGGEQLTNDLPIQFQGPDWNVEILREENVLITSRFQVNAVFIRFSSFHKDSLAAVIASYRKKTLRVGG